MPAMGSKSGGKKSSSSSSVSSFATPDRMLRGQERQERLLQQGLLASPFSPVPVRQQLRPSSNAHRRKQTQNSSAAGPSSIGFENDKKKKKNNNNCHHGHNNNNNKEEDWTKTNNNNIHRNNNNVVIFHLIRHGQSIAQTVNREQRLRDTNLWDCGLSPWGIQQALAIVLPPTVRMIVSSPLTRAVTTACLAAQQAAAISQQQQQRQQEEDGVTTVPSNTSIPILIHYHLRELGSMIPENIPRRIKDVQDDLTRQYGGGISGVQQHQLSMIDWDTLRPVDWPHRHDESPKLLRRDRVRDALYWLAMQYGNDHAEIAVVCHYHVIMSVLNGCGGGGKMVRADNAKIISCEMCRATGEIRLLSSSFTDQPSRQTPQQPGRHTTTTDANNDDDPMETD